MLDPYVIMENPKAVSYTHLDGKKPYGFLKSVLAYLVRPKLTYAGKPVKLEKEYPAQPITAVRSDIYGISD